MLTSPAAGLPQVIADWFAAKSWTPRRHQLEMLAAARARRNALLVAPTGAGKTLAGFLPSLVELVELNSSLSAEPMGRVSWRKGIWGESDGVTE